MEVLKISDSKVKIMLSYADITKFRLQDGELNYDDPKTRRKIFDILDCVKKHHGFDYEGDKLLIQFYPSKDGGAELFVTKLGILSPESAKVISKSDKITLLNAKRSIYVFESFVDLLCAAKAIRHINEMKDSELLLSENGNYYLGIYERGESKGGVITDFAPLLEFGAPISREKHTYILEHSERLIGSNAVKLLASLA